MVGVVVIGVVVVGVVVVGVEVVLPSVKYFKSYQSTNFLTVFDIEILETTAPLVPRYQ